MGDACRWSRTEGLFAGTPDRRALAERDAATAAGPGGCALHDIGRLMGEAIARAENLTRTDVRDALERIKLLPATLGTEGTKMGFGHYDHAALTGTYLVLREWRDGKSVQVEV